MSTSLYSPFFLFDLATKYQKNMSELMTVLNFRLPLLNDMMSDPLAASNPLNWMEVNRMMSEKMWAYGEAAFLFTNGVSQLRTDRTPTMQQLLKIQQKAARPVERTLSSNARRLSGKKRT